MTITRDDVRDLRPGDVVRLADPDWNGAFIQGPLTDLDGALRIGEMSTRAGGSYFVRRPDGNPPPRTSYRRTLTVISRAPRPFYVNADRDPVPGDVVTYPSMFDGRDVSPFVHAASTAWAGSRPGGRETPWRGLPGLYPDTGPLYNAGKVRLLLDGLTGKPVTS